MCLLGWHKHTEADFCVICGASAGRAPAPKGSDSQRGCCALYDPATDSLVVGGRRLPIPALQAAAAEAGCERTCIVCWGETEDRYDPLSAQERKLLQYH